MKSALKNKTAIHVYLVLKREARCTLFHREERKTRQHRRHEYFAIFKHDKRAEKQDSYRVLKPLRHVAMGAEFSVLNKPTQLSKWRRFQSHR